MPEISAGEVFDARYQILKVLGVGGLGVVYLAKQLDFQRTIALKVLHPNVMIDEEFKLRMQREAQALHHLAHPNIVTIYHLGVSNNDEPYIAMEYIQGKSLRAEILEQEKIAVTRALKIIKDAALALDFVHKQEIVHRDIKPDNIILVQMPEPDTVKIIDFGLARFTDEHKQKLTGTGDLIGTAQYMSPEQCAGKRADKRSDIYALTLCLFEMLTGDSPFNADTPVAVMYKHLNSVVPEIKTGSIKDFSPAINNVLQKGLAKDPDKRFQSMAELAAALDTIDDPVAGENGSVKNNNRCWLAWVLLLALVPAGFFFLRRAPQEAAPTNAPTRRLQRYTESVIESEMLRGNREKARGMCESTLGFPNIPALQRGRILIELAQLTRDFEPIVAYTEGARVLHKYRAEKLHCYESLIQAYSNRRLPHLARFYFRKLENNLKTSPLPHHDRDLYSFKMSDRKAALCTMMKQDDLKPFNPSFDKYFSQLEPLLEFADETENLAVVAREAFKARRLDIVKKLINSAKESNSQASIALICLEYMHPQLALEAIEKAKAVPIRADSHRPARELDKLIVEAKYLLDTNQELKARKLLSTNVIELVKLCKRDEREVELNYLPAIMYFSGLDMEAIWQAIGEKSPESEREVANAQMSSKEVQAALAKCDLLMRDSRLPLDESSCKLIQKTLQQKNLSKNYRIGLNMLLASRQSKSHLRNLKTAYEIYKENDEKIDNTLEITLLSTYGKVLLAYGMPSRARDLLEEAAKKSEKMPPRGFFNRLLYSDMILNLIEIKIRELKFDEARHLAADPIFKDFCTSTLLRYYLFLGMEADAERVVQKYNSQEDLNALLLVAREFHNESIANSIVSRATKLVIDEKDEIKRSQYIFRNTLNAAWNECEFRRVSRGRGIAKTLCNYHFKAKDDEARQSRMELAACLLFTDARAEGEKEIPSHFSNDAPAVPGGSDPYRNLSHDNEETENSEKTSSEEPQN